MSRLKVPGDRGYHFAWIRVVKDDASLSSNAKHIAGVLCDYFDKWGTWAIGRGELMLDMGVGSEDLITRYTGELVRAGYLTKRPGSRARGTTRYFGVIPPVLPERTLARIEKGVCLHTLLIDDDDERHAAETAHTPVSQSVETTKVPVRHSAETDLTIGTQQSVSKQSTKAPASVPAARSIVKKPKKDPAKMTAGQAGDWLRQMFNELHPPAGDAFWHDLDVLCMGNQDKKKMLVNGVISISNNSEALAAVRHAVLGDNEQSTWHKFLANRKLQTVHASDGTVIAEQANPGGDVAKLLLDRVWRVIRPAKLWSVSRSVVIAETTVEPEQSSLDLGPLLANAIAHLGRKV